MPVNHQITVSGYQGGNFTAVKLPRSTLKNCRSRRQISLRIRHFFTLFDFIHLISWLLKTALTCRQTSHTWACVSNIFNSCIFFTSDVAFHSNEEVRLKQYNSLQYPIKLLRAKRALKLQRGNIFSGLYKKSVPARVPTWGPYWPVATVLEISVR